jgi:hypothetical protein
LLFKRCGWRAGAGGQDADVYYLSIAGLSRHKCLEGNHLAKEFAVSGPVEGIRFARLLAFDARTTRFVTQLPALFCRVPDCTPIRCQAVAAIPRLDLLDRLRHCWVVRPCQGVNVMVDRLAGLGLRHSEEAVERALHSNGGAAMRRGPRRRASSVDDPTIGTRVAAAAFVRRLVEVGD